MSSTIRTDGLLIALAVLSLGGCKRAEPHPDAPVAPAVVASRSPSPTPVAAAASVRADPPPVAEAGSRVVDLKDIAVAGKKACAMTVRYVGLADQPVTWQGEPCGALKIAFMTLEQLEKLRQPNELSAKLSAEQREDVAALAGGKALYIEGGLTSAIYPANATDRVYSISLTD